MSEQGPGAAFHVTLLRTPTSARVLCLHGALDYDSGPSLRRALTEEIEARPPVLVLDLSDLQVCDSSGLKEFLWARLNRQGIPLVLAAPGIQFRQMLELTQTDKLFVVTESVPAALAYHEVTVPE
ncbi:STAS domain-containing protein [Streptomyces sp. TLI_171]|uniref:STAS domain-containing protein n=1 Tax=Streptomyces sp. TLI_171 TaxID=1938859 RepID=UPI000C52D9E6|nr:STAS domain-containing protein [Streptomyces sp. TLI_171]RKE05153.1 anti-sigma B factor antagonist [Streptomyces sp. TLI_171]